MSCPSLWSWKTWLTCFTATSNGSNQTAARLPILTHSLITTHIYITVHCMWMIIRRRRSLLRRHTTWPLTKIQSAIELVEIDKIHSPHALCPMHDTNVCMVFFWVPFQDNILSRNYSDITQIYSFFNLYWMGDGNERFIPHISLFFIFLMFMILYSKFVEQITN